VSDQVAVPTTVRVKGFGTIRKRGGVFWIRYTVGGKRREESSGSDSLKVAERLLRQRIQESGKGHRVDPTSENRVTMASLFDGLVVDYQNNARRSLKELQYRLVAIRAAFDGMKARDVNGGRIAEYVKERLAAGMAPASINRELAAIKRAFAIAVQQDRLSGAPYIKMLAESTPRQGFLRAPDLEHLVRHLPEDLRDFTRFAYRIGARKDAIAELTWADVDRDEQTITFRAEHDKAKQTRTISYKGVREIFEIIERRWAARVMGERLIALVFHRSGRKVRQFAKSWRKATTAAGVPGLLFHDLRRSAVRNMVNAGIGEAVAMKVSGHKTASIFRRYAIISADDTAAALAKTADTIRREAPVWNVRDLRAGGSR
jgi:integrase